MWGLVKPWKKLRRRGCLWVDATTILLFVTVCREDVSTMNMVRSITARTGGKLLITQWVHGGFIVVSGSKCPALTHRVHCDHFCNVLFNSPCKNPVGTG